jgi:ABC-type oligopeptide transport system substrate-binding subunit
MLKSFNLFFYIIIVFVSCETKTNLDLKSSKLQNRSTLRINLKENVLTKNPATIGSASEKFIKYLLYEGLYKVNKYGKTVPVLIQGHKIDSFTNVHSFVLKPKITLHNGELLNINHIYSRFKQIIDEETNHKIVQSFRQQIVGFNKYQSNKKYQIENDSLPIGFKIIGPSSFSIEFVQPQLALVTTLADPAFWIYSADDEKNYSGTGQYKIDKANGDISYNLIKHNNYHGDEAKGIETINIRFIKNPIAEANEFLNGSLDLIIPSDELNNKFQQTKYKKFNSIEISAVSLELLTFYNINNSYIKNLFFLLIQPRVSNKTVLAHNGSVVIITEETNTDSIFSLFSKATEISPNEKLIIQFLSKCKTNCDKTIDPMKLNNSDYFTFVEVSSKELNLNAPYIVIEERNEHVYTQELRELKKVTSKSEFSTITKYKRQNIYTDVSLKGFIPNTNWELGIQNLYFTKPRTLN